MRGESLSVFLCISLSIVRSLDHLVYVYIKQKTYYKHLYRYIYRNPTTSTTTYNVMSFGFGLCTDCIATEGMPFQVVGGCEMIGAGGREESLVDYFKTRTGGRGVFYGTVQQLRQELATRAVRIPHIHVLASTLPCSSRSGMKAATPGCSRRGDPLFIDQVHTIAMVRPDICYVEMVPPDKRYNYPADYKALEIGLRRVCGFNHVSTTIVNFSKYGEATKRKRWILVASRVPVSLPRTRVGATGCSHLLTPPEEVPKSQRVPKENYIPSARTRHPSKHNCLRTGTVTGVSERTGRPYHTSFHHRCYSPSHPWPCITGGTSGGGANGCFYVVDSKGPRKLQLLEAAKIHNLDRQAIQFLFQLKCEKNILKYIARSVPTVYLRQLYACFLYALGS